MNKNSPRQPQPEAEPSTIPNDRAEPRPKEVGGPKGPEPTRYGDWEKAGRCIDF